MLVCVPVAVAPFALAADQNEPGVAPGNQTPVPAQKQTVDKRILGVLPNYRTADPLTASQPLTSKQKLYIAYKDSFDWPSYFVTGAFAALYQMEDQNPSFGQGMAGYGKRYVGSFGDQVIGNVLAEGLVPILTREDPRYFPRLTGSTWSRTAYAVTRIFVTRTDVGGKTVNIAELGGNGAAVAISNAYYPDTRNVSDNVQKLSMQLATDAFSNVLKEFWPDIRRRLHHRHAAEVEEP